MKDPHYPGSYSRYEDIEVKVIPTFVPHDRLDMGVMDKINPEANIFIYRVEITNQRKDWVRLVTRNWKIIDSEGEEKIIHGKGVIGETPKLYQGESFIYSSFCPLEKEWGTMEGSYGMEDRSGNRFEVKINRFYLIKQENQKVKFAGKGYENQ